MLTQIPTHLIGGPLGAGKTSLIRNLLTQKPADERWAVLVNEFGQIGLDAALLSTDAAGIGIAEVAGGCLCCVNGLPFQVGLTRLLRQARPQRLLIEPSGLGHPAQLLRQLGQPPWTEVLAVQPSVLVLDAAALARGAALPDSQQQALDSAGLLVLNKSAAGASAGAGIRASASTWHGCNTGCTAGRGGAPSWCCMAKAAGGPATRWMARRCSCKRASGARIRDWS